MRSLRLLPGVLAGALLMMALLATSAAAAPETPLAQPATSVTATTAILHGELNPGNPGEAGEYQFLYKVSNTACRPEAEFIPEPPATSLGNEKEPIEIEAVNLEPNQTYAFCILALHAGEESQSASITFKTLPHAAPRIAPNSTAASEVTPFAATLEARVNPEKEETKYTFTLATNEALTENVRTIPGESALPPQFGELTASVPTGSSLTPSTTYYFKVSAENSTGSVEGPVESFETRAAEKPAIESEAVKNLNSSEPKLQARINPNYQETTYQFEYATSEEALLNDEGTVIKGAAPLPAVSEELLAGPVGVHGLQAGVIYYYRVVANNGTGTSEGEPRLFQALGTPAVGVGSAEAITRTTALVSGLVTPQGLPTAYHFLYIAQGAYEAALADGAPDPYAAARSTKTILLEESDYSAHPVQQTLSELTPATTYRYVLVADNELGATSGPARTFTTAAATAPVASTGGAEGVGEVSATITGSVDTQGLKTTAQFEIGTTPYAGALLPAGTTSSSGTVEQLAATFSSSLLPGTTYYYRVIATSRDGVSYGSERSFSTSAFAAPLAPAATPAFVPYSTIAELNAKESREAPKRPAPVHLTNAQKLAKALKACQKKPRARRAACSRQARRRYPVAKKRHGA